MRIGGEPFTLLTFSQFCLQTIRKKIPNRCVHMLDEPPHHNPSLRRESNTSTFIKQILSATNYSSHPNEEPAELSIYYISRFQTDPRGIPKLNPNTKNPKAHLS